MWIKFRCSCLWNSPLTCEHGLNTDVNFFYNVNWQHNFSFPIFSIQIHVTHFSITGFHRCLTVVQVFICSNKMFNKKSSDTERFLLILPYFNPRIKLYTLNLCVFCFYVFKYILREIALSGCIYNLSFQRRVHDFWYIHNIWKVPTDGV